MRILWITNFLFPEATSRISGEKELKSSGGWMLGAADALVESGQIDLTVASVSTLVTKLEHIQGKKIDYYALPAGQKLEPFWNIVSQNTRPDLVQIHGCECSYGLAYINACGPNNVVLSIQGVMSACHQHYYAGISRWEILMNMTARDLTGRSMFDEKRRFMKAGILEAQYLSRLKHVIGRTSFDKESVMSVNPDITYHLCNETLRREFYGCPVWKYANCRKHTIFMSQAYYPIKGLHQLLKAMPHILQEFPDTQIRIAGLDITKFFGISGIRHFSGYMKYLKTLIKKYDLKDKISFTGELNAGEMIREYLDANVFVCPSSIENSPNSLCEAQIIGVPCVASKVGGIPDLMKGDEDLLFHFNDTDALASNVCKVFREGRDTSKKRAEALERHDRSHNAGVLIETYKQIVCI